MIAIAATVLARWQWSRLADARFATELHSLRARGIPTAAADFTTPSCADDADNAAAALHNAAAVLVNVPTPLRYLQLFDIDRPWTAAETNTVAAVVLKNVKAIALSQLSIDRAYADWHVPSDPVTARQGTFAVIELPAQRALAVTLREAALLAHHRGDDAAAIEDLLAIMRAANAVEAGPPLLRTHAGAIYLQDFATDTLLRIAPRLNVTGTARSRSELLLARVFDEGALRVGGVRAVYGEARVQVTQIVSNSFSQRIGWLIQPMLQLDAERVLRIDDAAATAIASTSYLHALALLTPPVRSSPSLLINASHAFSLSIRPMMGSVIYAHFRSLHQRRQAAILLAARLFELDHRHPPARIDELIPEYLPKIPTDAGTGGPCILPATAKTNLNPSRDDAGG